MYMVGNLFYRLLKSKLIVRAAKQKYCTDIAAALAVFFVNVVTIFCSYSSNKIERLLWNERKGKWWGVGIRIRRGHGNA